MGNLIDVIFASDGCHGLFIYDLNFTDLTAVYTFTHQITLPPVSCVNIIVPANVSPCLSNRKLPNRLGSQASHFLFD